MRKGIAVSPGVAVGTAYCIHQIFVNPDTRRLEGDEVRLELARFDEARSQTAADLDALYDKVATQVGVKEAQIFRAHETILHDPGFAAKARYCIAEDRLTAPAALDCLLREYTALFAATSDEYLRERLGMCAMWSCG